MRCSALFPALTLGLGAIPPMHDSRFIEPRERGGGKVPFIDEQLTAMRGRLTAEQYRWKLIREWGEQ
jgi:hypothetical protein